MNNYSKFRRSAGYTNKVNDYKYFDKTVDGHCTRISIYNSEQTCPCMVEYNNENENNVPCDLAGYISSTKEE